MTNKQSPIYWTWSNMKRRCTDTNGKDASRYVNRGIGYDPKWESFKQFETDMLPTYKAGLTLDRIDNNKGYSPQNCRWATVKQQSNNTNRNRIFTINGITRTLAEWINTTNLKSSTVRQRVYVYKWPIEKSLGFNSKEGY